MPRKITLRDVADHAGVSVTTVSNVVRGWPHITDETRSKVQRAIRELGYMPHPIAQGLRSGRTQVIGFIVPDLGNPHFASMVSTVEALAGREGYSVLVFNTHEDAAREAECMVRVAHGWGDGILVIQTGSAQQASDVVKGSGVPVVAIDRVGDDYTGPYCRIDNVMLVRLVMEHLYELGHRRIAHLGGPVNVLPADKRVAYYRQFVQRHGMDYERIISSNYTWGSDEGYRATMELLAEDTPPTAIFAGNDRLAVGALHAIHDRGLRIPDDISLVGVDDIELSRHTTPPLTTIRQPVEAMLNASVEMLLSLIADDVPEETQISLQPTLVVRESTAPPAKEEG